MKALKKIIVLIIAVLLIIFFSFQLIMLNKYKTEETELNKDSIFNSTITIEHGGVEVEEVDFDGLRYGNLFDGFVDNPENNFKVKRDSEDEVIAYYAIFKEKQYVNCLSMNSFELYVEGSKEVDNSTEDNMRSLLEENNIKNDVDLLKYIKDNYYFKNNIFTCHKTMRNNYLLNSFVLVTMPSFDSITLINGDVEGYILNINRTIGLEDDYVDYTSNTMVRDIHLLAGDVQYTITLSGEEITNDEFINNLLKTISFY